MSSRQLEDRYDEEQADAVAEALGLSRHDLDQLDWTLQAHESDEGALYGHNVYFGEQSDPEVLARVGGLVNGEWVRIGLLPTDT